MKRKKIGFYFDAAKCGDWDWKNFLSGEIGMSGTDSQLLLLVNDLSSIYTVYFLTNVGGQKHENFQTLLIKDLEEAAILAKQMAIDLMIFSNRGDKYTTIGINKLSQLQQPFILWDQNGPHPDLEAILWKNESLKRIVFVSKIHANSHRHKRYFSKIACIYNGKDYNHIPETRANKDASTINIGYLGAVSESKGFHHVTSAWPKIRAAFPNATLCVIGSIRTHDSTRQTGDLGIAEPMFEDTFIKPFLGNNLEEIKSNGVSFTGHISPNEMNNHMTNLRLGIVNPNHGWFTETFCVSAIDFQAHNIPVVGANAGGLKETVANGRTGVLLNNSSELADVVIKLLKNKSRLEYLKGNCASWVKQKFSRDRIIAEWIKLIEDVLSGKVNVPVSISRNDINIKIIAKELIRIKNKLTIN